MSEAPVRDYLQTQGLRLNEDDVRTACLAAQAVMQAGQAEIERGILWYEQPEGKLTDYFTYSDENHTALKQIFMALDSAWSHASPALSAVVYAAAPEGRRLIRLAQQGRILEQSLPLTDEAAGLYLASRAAQSGWLSLAQDIPRWLAAGDLLGGHNRRSGSQMSLPICRDDGRVLGVLHLEAEHPNAFNEDSQAVWVALALAAAWPLQVLSGIPGD
ncbi:MAG: GAF domain-containing protein [Neisseria sp.]|nr:GAF domain-containing protein [Neisseria sp.]